MSSPESREVPEVAAAIERMHSLSAELDRQAVQYGAELRELRERFAREDEDRAELARSGELGREWQKLQQRIDLNETSIGAFVTGADDSPEADVLRQRAAARGELLYEEQALRVSEEGDPVIAETVGLQAEIRALVEEIAAMPRVQF